MDEIVARTQTTLALCNATLVLPNAVVRGGSITVRDGRIEGVEPDGLNQFAEDCEGDVLMPGIVDIHTDHFEKHVFPRVHVNWDPLSAALAHDAQVIGGGTTTVFDSLAVGSAEGDARRREILMPMVRALSRGRALSMFKADHLIHMRCEICDEATPELIDRIAGEDGVAVASMMDHTPGIRQTRNVEQLIRHRAAVSGRSEEDEARDVEERRLRSLAVTDRVRPLVLERLKATGLPLMSHDDATLDHVEEAHADGLAIAEFPTTLEAARAARARAMVIVAGAPNYLLGGSQSGNVAVRDLLAEGLVDVLASDYVPRSILDAVFGLAADEDLPIDLATAVTMATRAPAAAAGLTDRGALQAGLRADLIRVGLAGGQPFVKAVWREGRRVA